VKAIALVKQVPHPPSIEFDAETMALRREGVPLVLNPFDREAVAVATGIADDVVAMTMGPPQAEEALRECLALGATRCVHLTDRIFALADTLGTARTLALAIRKEGADVVVCGRKTIDSETWQVPPEVAAFLGWPHLTAATAVLASDGVLRITRQTDAGEDVYEVDPPVVVSVARPRPDPITPADGEIVAWSAGDLAPDVRPDDKRFGQTGSPTRVLAVRDVTPERARHRATTVEDAAAMVRTLLAERAREPSAWDKPDDIAEQPGNRYDAWTWVELVRGRPSRHSLQLVARGRQLAGKLGGQNVAIVLGAELGDVADELLRSGAERVVAVDDARLAGYHPETWAAALRHVLETHRPHVLLLPATADGRDLGPRVAGELELGMTGDCVGVDIVKAGRLLQQKPAYGGNIVSVIMGATSPQLATVRPGMYEALTPRDDAQGIVERFPLGELPEPRVRLVERLERPGSQGFDLDAADTVVCVGPEAGGADAVAQIEALAAEAGAAVGGTHEACQRGWLPHTREIGLYGRPVAPLVLVAVGASGEFWDVTGWVKAGVVVAVNPGVTGALDATSDVVIAGPWNQALPTLLRVTR
jgi:electron transfer flavoprotein alpha subunit